MATSPAPQPQDSSAAPGPMHAAIDHASEAAQAAGQRMQDSMAAARATLGDCVDEACLLGSECADSARWAVRARPLTAVAAALAVGLLVGRLCR